MGAANETCALSCFLLCFHRNRNGRICYPLDPLISPFLMKGFGLAHVGGGFLVGGWQLWGCDFCFRGTYTEVITHFPLFFIVLFYKMLYFVCHALLR